MMGDSLNIQYMEKHFLWNVMTNEFKEKLSFHLQIIFHKFLFYIKYIQSACLFFTLKKKI